MNLLFPFLNRLALAHATDVYSINAFYVRRVETRTCFGGFCVWVRLSYQKPYRGSHPGPEYDTWERVSHAGTAIFTEQYAAKVQGLLIHRHVSAHADY